MKLGGMRSFICYVLLALLPCLGWSQQELPADSSAIQARSFEGSLKEKYTEEVFKYESTVEGEAKNLISRGISSIVNTLSEWLGFEPDPATYRIVEMVVYGLLIVLTLYLVIRLLMGHSASQIFGKKDQELTAMSFEERDLKRQDLELAIKQALADGDFRLAMRYQYLILLQLLANKELIQWHSQKTNLDYIREIKQPGIRNQFKSVSYVFERYWYGEYPLSKQGYTESSGQFQNLKDQIENAG